MQDAKQRRCVQGSNVRTSPLANFCSFSLSVPVFLTPRTPHLVLGRLPQRDAAAARRRAFQTSTGRAEIARAVRRLKASCAVAATSNTAAAAAEATREAPQTNTAQGTHEERHTAVTQVAAAGTVSGEATGGAPANAGFSEDAGAKRTASVAKLSTSNNVAGAVDRVEEREKRSPLVEQEEQLFQLFDGEFSLQRTITRRFKSTVPGEMYNTFRYHGCTSP